MNIRIKVERFYEVEVPAETLEQAQVVLESTTDNFEPVVDWFIREKADYTGRYVFIEEADNFLEHDYIQLDA